MRHPFSLLNIPKRSEIFRLIKRGTGSSTCGSLTFRKSPGVKYGFVSLTKATVRKSIQTTQGLSVEDALNTHRPNKSQPRANSKCVDYSGNSKINRLVNLIDDTRGCPQIYVKSPRGHRLQAMTAVSIAFELPQISRLQNSFRVFLNLFVAVVIKIVLHILIF